MDRQIDTSTIGRISLENTEIESGDNISNIQQRINENTIKMNPTQSLLSGESMSIDSIHKLQYFRVVGNGGAVTLTTPFTGTPKDGTIIYVVGTDDSNTVEVEIDDSAGGLYVNGDAILKRGYILNLVYDAVLDRYFEIGRNF